MTTTTIIDYRRTDLRTNVLETPYWISSGRMFGPDCEDLAALCFSFPTAGLITIVMQVVFQVEVAFTSSTLIHVASGTLATDAVTTAGVVTEVDADEYMLHEDITVGTAGYYGCTTSNTSDWLTAKAAGTWAAPLFITGAASTVPCVYVTMTNSGTIAAGYGRLHMLITNVPGKN